MAPVAVLEPGREVAVSFWLTFFLVLHVLVAIAAFGPSYAYPVIGRFAQEGPQSARLVARMTHAVQVRVQIPGAIVMPFLGLALVYLGHYRLWQSQWLVISIALYTIAFFYAVGVQTPLIARMSRALARLPDPPPAGGPPPEIGAMARRVRVNGIFLTTLITAIVILMVWKPGNCQGVC
ncbi:MAG TPA: DUF2269 family protein [Actinomycetota bacterium]|nr:DUF2269 family protein [Actinomycetota bacterium]